jgi:hypothetical protein
MTDKEKIRQALIQAGTIIYLEDSADYLSGLWEVIKVLATSEQLELADKDIRELIDQLKKDGVVL